MSWAEIHNVYSWCFRFYILLNFFLCCEKTSKSSKQNISIIILAKEEWNNEYVKFYNEKLSRPYPCGKQLVEFMLLCFAFDHCSVVQYLGIDKYRKGQCDHEIFRVTVTMTHSFFFDVRVYKIWIHFIHEICIKIWINPSFVFTMASFYL